MPRRPSKPGRTFRQHVPVSPSRPPVNGTDRRKMHTSEATSSEELERRRLKPQIELPNREVRLIERDSEFQLPSGGKISWPVPTSWRSNLGQAKVKIVTTHPIVVLPGLKLKLHIWECKEHCFGPAILDQLGLLRPIEEGGKYCYKKGRDGDLVEMDKAEFLWNLLR
ncbi:hypothetical protein [Shimazuella kribbensis]|uniref:hypothetical protein n=1 Tax=Shimazuella kribbensis TaxID=139808 RepID=UPI000421C8CF|nr:hypothetical protein [Shimazuella kribbensis]